jgi:O-antigen ligase
MLFGLLSLNKIELSFIVVIGMLAMMAFIKAPHLGLAAVIFLLPFSNFPLLDQQIAGIPGMKVSNLLPLAALFTYMFVNLKLGLRKMEFLFVAGIVLFLTIGVVKSLPHLNEINYSLYPKLGPAKYILTYFVKPIIFLFPFIIIVSYIKKVDDLDVINKIIKFSIVLFSSYLLLFYILEVPNKLSLTSVNAISQEFNMHRNDLVNFYIISYPIIMANLLIRKSLFNIFNLLMCLICVGLLYSRTGYAIIVFSTLLLLSLTKNKKWFPILILIGTIAFTLVPIQIVERSTAGFETNDIDTISSGRTERIWKPLIDEFTDNPVNIIFGKGTNAIRFSKSFQRGYILRVGNAHNMYLELALEVGIIGLAFFLSFFIYYLFFFFRSLKKLDIRHSLLMNGIIVSLISFLISGLTGRQFFPCLQNSYLWVVLAFGIAIIEVDKKTSKGSASGNTEGLINDIEVDRGRSRFVKSDSISN